VFKPVPADSNEPRNNKASKDLAWIDSDRLRVVRSSLVEHVERTTSTSEESLKPKICSLFVKGSLLLVVSPPFDEIFQVPLADVAGNGPGAESVALRKDLFDLLQSVLRSLWEAEREVNRSREVESSKHKVRFPCDRKECGGNSPGESEIEQPVGCGGKGDSLGANFHGEDFGGICPRDGAYSDGERGDEQVGANNDSIGDRSVASNNPDGGTVNGSPCSIFPGDHRQGRGRSPSVWNRR
jgi:hypothetical protein